MFSKRISRLIKILSGVTPAAEEEFFQLEGRVERFTHFWVVVARNFIRNRCFIRSSALAYTSLLALIPLLAVAVSVTSSLLKKQGEDQIYQAIDKFVSNIMPPASVIRNSHGATLHLGPGRDVTLMPADEAPVVNWGATNVDEMINLGYVEEGGVETMQKEAAKSIHDYIQTAKSGTLGLTGMIAFVFVAIMMLSRVEDTFNDIWGVARGRRWLWRIVLYWATITLGPLLLVGALGLAGSSHFQTAKNLVSQTNVLGNFLLELAPVGVLWFTFTLVYLLMPNTRVQFGAALAGGAVAGILWHLNSYFGFLYVSRAMTNSKIYGGLGLVPVFMLGLYFSWVILLFGVQVAYAFQNRSAYLQDRLADTVNQRGREFVALRLMTSLAQRFQNGLRPPTVLQLSSELGIPGRLTQSVLSVLVHNCLVTEVNGHEPAYVPARPLEAINAYDILLALRAGAGQELPQREDPVLAEIYGEFARIEKAERETATAISLRALIDRLPARALPEPEATRDEKKSSTTTIVKPVEPTDSVAVTIQPETPKTSPISEEQRRKIVRPDEDTGFPL